MTMYKWPKHVQSKGILTYEAHKSFGGQWAMALGPAIAEFNQQMDRIGLKLTVEPVKEGMGAHIVFQTEQGNGLHGKDDLLPTVVNGKKYMYTATIRVPATPRILPNDPKSREVGPGVRLCILVHELIHAVGLHNDEHTKERDDVFSASVLLKAGAKPADDLVEPDKGGTMPPIRIGAATTTKLTQAWDEKK